MPSSPTYVPYEPQLSPVEWDENIWTVEGPEVTYRLAGVPIPCPTRMTVVRSDDGSLLLHSPVCYSEQLSAALATLGPITMIVAPNSYHYLHVDDWVSSHTFATTLVTRAVAAKVSAECGFLDDEPEALFRLGLSWKLINLGRFQEMVFFHQSSRTLIVTDLMQNFEATKVRSRLTRFFLKAGGATGPSGEPSVEIRCAAWKHKAALSDGIQQMLDWEPNQIILSHGKCYRSDAVGELNRAFAWHRR